MRWEGRWGMMVEKGVEERGASLKYGCGMTARLRQEATEKEGQARGA
jgi:hypothetical protein